jgi:uncharacterized membrane protein YkvI
MSWPHLVSYVFGGAVFANAIPHWVAGSLGRPFQSPFAKPPGEGLSSATINVLWGGFNLIVAYLLLVRVGDFDIRDLADIGSAGLGAALITLFSARHFGRFNGGNAPTAQ